MIYFIDLNMNTAEITLPHKHISAIEFQELPKKATDIYASTEKIHSSKGFKIFIKKEENIKEILDFVVS